MGHPSEDLTALVETLGGVVALASYLDLPQETLEIALAAPPGGRTDGVARMVAENTWKLAGMPSQGGYIWRVTRRRVVKDWLILARRSAAVGGQAARDEAETEARELTDDQKRLLTGLARLGPDVLDEFPSKPDEVTQTLWEAGAPGQLPDQASRQLEASAEEEIEREEPSVQGLPSVSSKKQTGAQRPDSPLQHSDLPLSEVSRSADDVLIKDVPQPYLDLAHVLDRDLFDHLYEGFRQTWIENHGTEPGPFFSDNPSWVVGGFLQSSLEPKGYRLEQITDLYESARASGESVSFDLQDLRAEPSRDIDYWPDIDLDAAWTHIAEFWGAMYEEAGGAKYYPGWLVRRQVAFNVIQAAVDSRPELDAEMGEAYASLGLSEEDPYEENGQADEQLEALLEAYHLRQIVDSMVQSLSAEDSDDPS